QARPAIAAEWHPTRNDLAPHLVAVTSRQVAWWRCSACGYEWKTRVGSRTGRDAGSGCPECARRSRHAPPPGASLLDTHPHIAAEWDPLNTMSPDAVSPGSSITVVW